MSDDSQDWWKIVTAIGTVALLALTLVELSSEPTAEVEAEVSRASQYHPPGVRQVMSDFDWRFSEIPLVGSARDSLWLSAYPDSALYDERAYRLFREAWRIIVTNDGDVAADSVVLSLPMAQYARIDREGTGPIFQTVHEGVLELGSLRPDQAMELVVWSRHATRYPDLTVDDMAISHRAGRGNVDYERPVAEIFQWLDQHPMTSLWLAATALIGILALPESFYDVWQILTSGKNGGGHDG